MSDFFWAVLLHACDSDLDRAIRVPAVAEPPTRITVPTRFAGVAAFDVYEFVSMEHWPLQAVYRHVATVPR